MTSVVVELSPGTRMVESHRPRKEITFRGHSVIMWLRSKMKILNKGFGKIEVCVFLPKALFQ